MSDASIPEFHALLRVPPAEIVFVTAVLEGYDGLCTTSSIQDDPTTLRIVVAGGQEDLLREILANLELIGGPATLTVL